LILTKGTRGKKFIETQIAGIELIKTKRTTARRICNTVLSGVGFVVVITIAVASSGQKNRRNYSNSGSSSSDHGGSNLSRPPRPLNRYWVNRNSEKWKEQRVLLNRLL